MRGDNLNLYGPLLLVSAAVTIGGIITLIPSSGASYPNILGYRSVCTFAPAATLFCFLIAGITCTLRASLVKRRRLYGKASANKGAIITLIIVAFLALGATAWYLSVKADYTDAESAATPEAVD